MKKAKKMKSNFCSLVCSKRTVITVIATLAVVAVVILVACGVMRNHFHSMMKNPEVMAQHKAEKMAKRFDLNDAQKAQVQKFMLADIKNMKAMREAKMAKRKTDMKSVLTPEQYAKWEAKMEKRMKKWEN